jgi:mRNA interferase MazF
MKRGEIWTVSGAPGFGSKPRPVLIVQSDRLHGTQTVLACGFTSQTNVAVPFRPLIDATPETGLKQSSTIMIEKLAAVSRTKLGERIGALPEDDLERVEQALQLVLGFAG